MEAQASRGLSAPSHPGLHLDPALLDGLLHGREVALRLVGVGPREIGDRPLECVAAAEVRGDGVAPAGARGLRSYGEACGWALARGHARSGRRDAIAAYLGGGDAFERALADFARSYADQTERDFAAVQQAVKKGRIQVETGV